MNLYLIPGLGTDQRIFESLVPLLDKKAKIHYLNFIEPLSVDEPLVDYSKRMATKITETNELIILGLSLGGMVATEVAKYFPNAKLIILSSMKHQDERPKGLLVLRKLKAYSWLNPKVSRWLFVKLMKVFGMMTPKDQQIFKEMLYDSPDIHFNWARKAALLWDNQEYPKNFIHIHGTNDHIFPHKSLKTDVKLIQKANHSMVINQAKETADYINEFLG
jgi:esterase/lipase